MTVVREDERGIFIVAGGYVARPGDARSYSHAYRMDDAGLKKGDRVYARHRGGTPLTKVRLEDGTELHWIHDNSRPEELVKSSSDLERAEAFCDLSVAFDKKTMAILDTTCPEEAARLDAIRDESDMEIYHKTLGRR